MSGGDLGDILETDTPPASPGQALSPITIDIATANTTVHYRKPESVKTEETDVDSLSPTSKVCSPISRSSPPPPSSISVGRSVSPVMGGRPFSPPSMISPPSEAGSSGGGSGGGSISLLQHDQPQRIAEYKRASWYADENEEKELAQAAQAAQAAARAEAQAAAAAVVAGEDAVEEATEQQAAASSVSGSQPRKPAPMIRQNTEPILKYKPFQQVLLLQENAIIVLVVMVITVMVVVMVVNGR